MAKTKAHIIVRYTPDTITAKKVNNPITAKSLSLRHKSPEATGSARSKTKHNQRSES